MQINTPLTKESILKLSIGDVVEITGNVYTARDAAHKRLADCIASGDTPPIDLENITFYYAGPCPAKPGRVIGPIGPTTSERMDPFVETLLKKGMIGMIGKGDRSDYIPALCREYKAVYFLGIGGAAAIDSACVTGCEVVCYEDLGTESVKKLTVKNLKVIVGIDVFGNVLQEREINKYKIK